MHNLPGTGQGFRKAAHVGAEGGLEQMEPDGNEGGTMISIRWRQNIPLIGWDWQTAIFASDTAAIDWLIANQDKIATMAIERY